MENRKPFFFSLIIAAAVAAAVLRADAFAAQKRSKPMENIVPGKTIDLPRPVKSGASLDEALGKRRSVRQFAARPLSLAEISQLLWAGQGRTRDWGGRTAPSAGALYPLELYVAVKEGVFHYRPAKHQLAAVAAGDVRGPLAAAALNQGCVGTAPAVFVIAAVYERTAIKYRDRAPRYVHIEAGHAGQNIMLEAAALGLGSVPVGAFQDDAVRRVLKLPADHAPLLLIPVGHPVQGQ
jgi:SagB-type dehydrogenase family enzyme